MTVDINKIKVGDKITVELVVDSLPPRIIYSNLMAGPPGQTRRHDILVETIVGHTPKPLPAHKVGDSFFYKETELVILYIDNGCLLYTFPNGGGDARYFVLRSTAAWTDVRWPE